MCTCIIFYVHVNSVSFSVLFFRFDAKDLLNHEFFAEGEFKVEVVDSEGPKGDIPFRMEVSNKDNKKDRQESVVDEIVSP